MPARIRKAMRLKLHDTRKVAQTAKLQAAPSSVRKRGQEDFPGLLVWVLGATSPSAQLRNLGSNPDSKWRVHLAYLRGFRARVEPFPAPHFERAERRREEAVRPIHFAGDEIVGARPVARRRAPLVHVAHELRPRGRDDTAAAGVVHDAPLQVVADPDAGHDLRREPDEPGI